MKWLWQTIRFWVAYFWGRWDNMTIDSLRLLDQYPYERLLNKDKQSIFDKHDIYCYRLVFRKNKYATLR